MKRSQGLIEIPQHILSAILFFSFQHLPAIMFTTYMPPLVHNFDDSHMSCRLFTLIVFLLTFPFYMAKNKTFTFQSECLVIALSWGEINFGNICKVFVSLRYSFLFFSQERHGSQDHWDPKKILQDPTNRWGGFSRRTLE